MLLQLVYLSVTNVFTLLRLIGMNDRDKDVEILVLRHQVTVLQRQLGTTRPQFSPGDRAFLTALLHRLPRDVLGRFRLLVRACAENSSVLVIGVGPPAQALGFVALYGAWERPRRSVSSRHDVRLC